MSHCYDTDETETTDDMVNCAGITSNKVTINIAVQETPRTEASESSEDEALIDCTLYSVISGAHSLYSCRVRGELCFCPVRSRIHWQVDGTVMGPAAASHLRAVPLINIVV